MIFAVFWYYVWRIFSFGDATGFWFDYDFMTDYGGNVFRCVSKSRISPFFDDWRIRVVFVSV